MIGAAKDGIIARRGKEARNIAAARRLLTLVFYGLRQVRGTVTAESIGEPSFHDGLQTPMIPLSADSITTPCRDDRKIYLPSVDLAESMRWTSSWT